MQYFDSALLCNYSSCFIISRTNLSKDEKEKGLNEAGQQQQKKLSEKTHDDQPISDAQSTATEWSASTIHNDDDDDEEAKVQLHKDNHSSSSFDAVFVNEINLDLHVEFSSNDFTTEVVANFEEKAKNNLQAMFDDDDDDDTDDDDDDDELPSAKMASRRDFVLEEEKKSDDMEDISYSQQLEEVRNEQPDTTEERKLNNDVQEHKLQQQQQQQRTKSSVRSNNNKVLVKRVQFPSDPVVGRNIPTTTPPPQPSFGQQQRNNDGSNNMTNNNNTQFAALEQEKQWLQQEINKNYAILHQKEEQELKDKKLLYNLMAHVKNLQSQLDKEREWRCDLENECDELRVELVKKMEDFSNMQKTLHKLEMEFANVMRNNTNSNKSNNNNNNHQNNSNNNTTPVVTTTPKEQNNATTQEIVMTKSKEQKNGTDHHRRHHHQSSIIKHNHHHHDKIRRNAQLLTKNWSKEHKGIDHSITTSSSNINASSKWRARANDVQLVNRNVITDLCKLHGEWGEINKTVGEI